MHAKSSCSSCLRRQDVCHYDCRFSVYVYLSLLSWNAVLLLNLVQTSVVTVIVPMCFFYSRSFIVQDHREGVHCFDTLPVMQCNGGSFSLSPHSVTGAPSEPGVYWKSSQRCVEVNALLDMLLYWWGSKGRTMERRGL